MENNLHNYYGPENEEEEVDFRLPEDQRKKGNPEAYKYLDRFTVGIKKEFQGEEISDSEKTKEETKDVAERFEDNEIMVELSAAEIREKILREIKEVEKHKSVIKNLKERYNAMYKPEIMKHVERMKKNEVFKKASYNSTSEGGAASDTEEF